MIQKPTLASTYEQLTADRQPFLDRGRKCSELTIPSLLPPEKFTSSSDLYVPYQSIGARGVNTLANKLLITLLPPNTPFFRLSIDDFTLEELTQQEDMRAEVEKILSTHERAIMTDIGRANLYSPVVEALKLLLVSGNGLLTFNKEGRARSFRLDSYVVLRDHDGKVLKVIIKEVLKYQRLPADLKAMVDEANNGPSKDQADIELFTCYEYEDGKYITYQEIVKTEIPGTRGSYKETEAPFMALRWTQIDGENYGRGHVEDYVGDLNALEGLSRALLEGAAAAARFLLMVKPGATVSPKDINEAPNASAIVGDIDEIGVLSANKNNDFRTVQLQVESIEQRLAYAFLMNTAVQRKAERVTAEEIRFMASELEDALGGNYSLLSGEFQLPLVRMRQSYLTRKKKLPKLPEDVVEPSIVTGLEALGRGHDLTKLDLFYARIQKLGPQAAARIKEDELIERMGASLGIDTDGLLKTDEEMQAEQQQAMQAQMMSDVVKGATPQVARAATE